MRVKQKLTNILIVTENGVIEADLLIDGDRFAQIVNRDENVGSEWQIVDGAGRIAFPGMIDLLQHGMGKYLYSDTVPEAVAENSEFLLRAGTTSFLPSIGCTPPDIFAATLTKLSDQCTKATGARALGVHSEGPCFALAGAHNPQNIQMPSAALAEMMLNAAQGRLAAVTIAPELPGAEEFVRALKAAGVSIHLGHSDAPPGDVPTYVSWGIDAVTHMYNAMPTKPYDGMGIHPFSLSDALIAESDIALGLICDGVHTDPKLVKLLAQLPSNRAFLETDAMRFAGTGKAEFEFYPGYWVRSEPGNAVHDRKGGLCGSSLTSDEAMRNFAKFADVDLARCAHATSLTPARVMGRDNDLGSIAPGKYADFALLHPETHNVDATYVGGVKKFDALS